MATKCYISTSAFHGRSGYTMSLTNTDPKKTRYFPKFDWPRIHNPAVQHPLNSENLKQVIHEEELALAQARQYLESYKDEIACILLEPIQGEGGDNHFRKEFHQGLRDLADELMCVTCLRRSTNRRWAYR